MNQDQITALKQHLFDFGKGLIAAAVASAGVAIVQYAGAHLPDLISFITVWAAGIVGVKAK